jgi:hypothetical protein
MMLNNQDEIAEFDKQLGEILRGLEGITNEQLRDQVRSLMATLFFHDFAEWCTSRGRWAIPDFAFEEFDGDTQPIRSLAHSCIKILQTEGKAETSELTRTGKDYLRQRGVAHSTSDENDFTEPLPKRFVAEVVFLKSTDWLKQQVDSGVIVAKTTKKFIQVHIDSMPTLKRRNERTTALATWKKTQ